ncbi:MAG: hypothetical protein K1000chlam1_01580, partial [Candidatus Anoxychlamydiales bacterium]|nr:hypothetical protein [Candidatus Anoxychlamydiales bacterium]
MKKLFLFLGILSAFIFTKVVADDI